MDISIVDIASATVTGTIQLSAFQGTPAVPNIAILPDGSRAYVTYRLDPVPALVVIDLASRSVIAQLNLGSFAASSAISPDGAQIWITCRGSSQLFVIDTLTNTVAAGVQSLALPLGVDFHPNGSVAYVAEAPDGVPGDIAAIDTATLSVLTRIPVGILPHVVKVTPTGRHVFVTNLQSNSLTQISTAANKVVRTIPSRGVHPLGIAFIR